LLLISSLYPSHSSILPPLLNSLSHAPYHSLISSPFIPFSSPLLSSVLIYATLKSSPTLYLSSLATYPNSLSLLPSSTSPLIHPSSLPHPFSPPTATPQARPVIKGRKYAANSWIHLYDYEHSNLWGCTGTFDVL
jgi:hypothetical protein